MFKYLKRKLGLDLLQEIRKDIKNVPTLNDRYLELLTPMEAVYKLLLKPEGDDTLIMHHLRCMGLCGGWEVRRHYLKGALHGQTSDNVREAAEAQRKENTTTK